MTLSRLLYNAIQEGYEADFSFLWSPKLHIFTLWTPKQKGGGKGGESEYSSTLKAKKIEKKHMTSEQTGYIHHPFRHPF